MKSGLIIALLFVVSNVFAMGHTDNEKIKEQQEKLKSDGYECKNVWPKDIYESQIEANGKFELGYECKKDASLKKFVIVYEMDASVGARCRDKRAISMKEAAAEKQVSKDVEDSQNEH